MHASVYDLRALELPLGTSVRVREDDYPWWSGFAAISGATGRVLSLGARMSDPPYGSDRLHRVELEGHGKVNVIGSRHLEVVEFPASETLGDLCPVCGIGSHHLGEPHVWYCRCCGSRLSRTTVIEAL